MTAAKPSKLPPLLRRIIRLAKYSVVLGIAFVIYVNLLPIVATRNRTYNHVSEVPHFKVGLVFGTSDRIQGHENLYYRYRIQAAAELWNAQKIDTIIVSGDNRTRDYNEPEKMRRSLIAAGIPADRIVCDFAGLRTLDSVVRAKEVFGADPILYISQKFQNERAIYIGMANGLECYGYNAKDVEGQSGTKTKVREIGARIKMWLDLHFLNTRPRHLGERHTLPPPLDR